MTGKKAHYSSIITNTTVSKRYGDLSHDLIMNNGSAAADVFANCRFFAMSMDAAYAEEAGKQYEATGTETESENIK